MKSFEIGALSLGLGALTSILDPQENSPRSSELRAMAAEGPGRFLSIIHAALSALHFPLEVNCRR